MLTIDYKWVMFFGIIHFILLRNKAKYYQAKTFIVSVLLFFIFQKPFQFGYLFIFFL